MRVLGRQSEVLDGLRNRAYILLTANSIVAALFASSFENSQAQHHLVLAILALVAFAVAVTCCIGTLWSVRDAGILVDPASRSDHPRWPWRDRPRRWRVTFDLQTVADFHEKLADWGAYDATVNEFKLARDINWETINRRTKFLQAACALLPIQIALWAALALV